VNGKSILCHHHHDGILHPFERVLGKNRPFDEDWRVEEGLRKGLEVTPEYNSSYSFLKITTGSEKFMMFLPLMMFSPNLAMTTLATCFCLSTNSSSLQTRPPSYCLFQNLHKKWSFIITPIFSAEGYNRYLCLRQLNSSERVS